VGRGLLNDCCAERRFPPPAACAFGGPVLMTTQSGLGPTQNKTNVIGFHGIGGFGRPFATARRRRTSFPPISQIAETRSASRTNTRPRR
jgi:hypothetical protein